MLIERPVPFVADRPPLLQAIAQMQFPQIARLSSLEGVQSVQDMLLDIFPYMHQQEVQEMMLTFGAGGANQQTSSNKVTRFTDDSTWVFELTPGAATLTADAAAYQSADHFADRLVRVLSATSSVPGMRRCERVGVRYINVIPTLRHEDEWFTWFRTELTGWTRPELLAKDAELQATLTESRVQRHLDGPLSWASRVESVVRHGLVPAGSLLPVASAQPLAETAFLLDLDLFVAEPQGWDANRLVEQYRSLHSEIEAFFFWSLTDAGKAQFGVRSV